MTIDYQNFDLDEQIDVTNHEHPYFKLSQLILQSCHPIFTSSISIHVGCLGDDLEAVNNTDESDTQQILSYMTPAKEQPCGWLKNDISNMSFSLMPFSPKQCSPICRKNVDTLNSNDIATRDSDCDDIKIVDNLSTQQFSNVKKKPSNNCVSLLYIKQ